MIIHKIFVNADGGSRGNPGPAAIGVVLRDETGKVIETYNHKIGVATNNIAEYKALIKSLELAKKYTAGELIVHMDSELVVRQVSGQYKVKAKHLKPLADRVRTLSTHFKKVTYSAVPREDLHQSQADILVNSALDQP